MLSVTTDIDDTLTADAEKAFDQLEADLHVASIAAAEEGVRAMQERHPYTDRTTDLTMTMEALTPPGPDAYISVPAPYASYVNAANQSNGHRKNYEFMSRGEKTAARVLEQEGKRAVATCARNVKRGGL